MKKTKNMNTKGFSLVELIIVVAIMAVLVGVIAPAYLRYVEKSRKSADVQAIDAVMSAMEAAAIDPSLEFSGTDVSKYTMTVILSNSGEISVSQGDGGTAYKTELEETLGDYQLKSKDWAKIGIKGTVSGGTVTFEYEEEAASGKGLLDYAKDLATDLKPGNVY